MKLLLTAAALAGALALLAGPALSVERWRPEAVDFEFAPPPAALSAARAGGVVSEPLRAPARFNLVGMRWRGRAEPEIRVRVREHGERWSRWQALAAHADHNPDRARGERRVAGSEPLWVGAADELQYRLSRRVPALRLHFVNVQGSATPAERLRTALRGTANAAVASLAGLVGAGAASAQDAQPDVVTRTEWGASQCPPRSAPEHGRVEAVHVHHTVSLNDYAPEEAPGIVLAICRFHRNSNGWNDIGYNALVDKYGVLYEGRAGGLGEAVIGAQAQGFNAQTSGISNIGDHTDVEQTPEALAALASYIRWKLPHHGVPTSGEVTLTSAGGSSSRYAAGARVTVPRVLGHRDTNSTACPGDALYAQLDDLRAMVESGAPAPPSSAPQVTAALNARAIDFGETLELSGRVAGPDGAALAGAAVQLDAMSDGRWRRVRGLTSGSDGFFATELRPRLRMYLRVRTLPGAALRGASSQRLLIRVRPRVTLGRASRTPRRGAPVRVRGRVAPRKRAVRLVLQQRVRGAWRRVGARTVAARSGRFSGSFVPAYAARYRFYVVAPSDDDTDRGRSDPRELLVAR